MKVATLHGLVETASDMASSVLQVQRVGGLGKDRRWINALQQPRH